MHPCTHSDSNVCTHGVADKSTNSSSVGVPNARPNGIAFCGSDAAPNSVSDNGCSVGVTNAHSNGVADKSTNIPPNSVADGSTNSSTHSTNSSTLCNADKTSNNVADERAHICTVFHPNGDTHGTHSSADSSTCSNFVAHCHISRSIILFVLVLILGLRLLRSLGCGSGVDSRYRLDLVATRQEQPQAARR
jgi:hypothetical protein